MAVDLVFNIASAQFSVFISPIISIGPPILGVIQMYSGLIWNLINNSYYAGMGTSFHLGPFSTFTSIKGDYTGMSLGLLGLYGAGARYGFSTSYAIELYTKNGQSSEASIGLAAAWGAGTTAMATRGKGAHIMLAGASIASFWAFGKWSFRENLIRRQLQHG